MSNFNEGIQRVQQIVLSGDEDWPLKAGKVLWSLRPKENADAVILLQNAELIVQVVESLADLRRGNSDDSMFADTHICQIEVLANLTRASTLAGPLADEMCDLLVAAFVKLQWNPPEFAFAILECAAAPSIEVLLDVIAVRDSYPNRIFIDYLADHVTHERCVVLFRQLVQVALFETDEAKRKFARYWLTEALLDFCNRRDECYYGGSKGHTFEQLESSERAMMEELIAGIVVQEECEFDFGQRSLLSMLPLARDTTPYIATIFNRLPRSVQNAYRQKHDSEHEKFMVEMGFQFG